MASVLMREARMMQYHCPSLRLSPKQQTIWFCSVYRSTICRFSNSSGPVRYVPKLRKTPAQTQDEQNSILNHQVDDRRVLRHHLNGQVTSMHVRRAPTKTQQHIANPDLVECGHRGPQHLQQKADAGSSPSIGEEDATSVASIQLSHDYDHKGKSVSGSSQLLDAQISSKQVLGFSQHNHSQVCLLDSSYHLGKVKERNEEERSTSSVYVEPQNAMHNAGQSPRDSTDLDLSMLPTDVLQTGQMDAENLEDVLQTREKGLSVNAEKKVLLQTTERSSSLSHQHKYLKKREGDIKGRKVQPWKDAESFLLKVQGAEQEKSLKLNVIPHIAPSKATNISIVNKAFNSDVTDDGFPLLEQESVEESEDVQAAFPKLNSRSIAEREHAKNQAVRYLSMRPYTALQLREKLIGRSISPDLADYAISTVQSCGLQSDLAYAETFSWARFKHASWGPQRIKLGLKQRGISTEIIKAAIDKVFTGEESIAEQDGAEIVLTSSSVKMSKAVMDHLLAQAMKQWNRGRNATNETKTRRMVSWLQYRGFNYGIIKHVLNHLQNSPMKGGH